jgi:hypothetical protein
LNGEGVVAQYRIEFPTVQVCDATGDDSSTTAKYTKEIFVFFAPLLEIPLKMYGHQQKVEGMPAVCPYG